MPRLNMYIIENTSTLLSSAIKTSYIKNPCSHAIIIWGTAALTKPKAACLRFSFSAEFFNI